MNLYKLPVSRRLNLYPFAFLGLCLAVSLAAPYTHAQAPANAASPVGTIKSISGNTIVMKMDNGGADATVQVQDATKYLRIAPGQTSLKDAAAIQLSDLQAGDRILVRGTLAADGKTVAAIRVVAMKLADISQKLAHDREEWQKHGLAGLVSSVDAASTTITVSLPSLTDKKTVAVHLSGTTVIRRYSPDSVKFDDARAATLDQVKAGDQLRARGTRSADGSELAADEVVAGTFRNIAGTISALDASAGTLTIQDLVTKKPITVKITADSQLRKLPQPMAQRIAARLKGTPDATPASASSGTPAAPQAPAAGGAPSGGQGPGGPGGMNRHGGGAGGGGDFQQMISRMPASTLADLQKGDAVMVVATEGSASNPPSVITLLGGVEPILVASPKDGASTLLSPWSLGSGGAEAAAP